MDQIRATPVSFAAFATAAATALPHPGVKRLGNDIIGGKLFVRNQTGKSIGGSQLHLIIDIACSYVEGAAEYTGERKHIVDLVREITPAGRYDLCPAGLCVIRKDLGSRIRAGKNNSILGHGFYHICGYNAGSRNSDEHIGAFQHICQSTGLLFQICDFCHFFFDGIHPFFTAFVNSAVAVT